MIRRLGTDEIPRLRIGIGPPPPGRDATGHVLGRFSKDERAEIGPVLTLAAQGAADWVEHGLKHCMNQYNA